jgi:predicted metal-binding membrane protein
VALPQAHRALLLAASLTVTLTAWWWLYRSPHHANAAFLSAVVMWQAMTLAMMTPTTLNWLFAFAAFARSGGRSVSLAVSEFTAGYFVVWLGFNIAAAGLQIALQHVGVLAAHGGAPRGSRASS